MAPPDRPYPGVSGRRGIPWYAVSLYRVMALARQGQSIYRATVNDDSDAQFAVTMVTYTLTPDPELQKGKSPIKNRALQIPLGEIKLKCLKGPPPKLYERLAHMSTLCVWDESSQDTCTVMCSRQSSRSKTAVVPRPDAQSGIDVPWLVISTSSNSNLSRPLEHIGWRRGGG